MPPLSRRRFLRGFTILGGSALLAGCQPRTAAPAPAPALEPGSQAADRWQQVLAAARQEGTITVYGGPSARTALHEPFERAYPGIKIDGTYGPGNQLVARVIAERQSGRNIADVLVGPGTSGLIELKPIGALAPVSPMLLLPEVLDRSKWFENRLWWGDAEEPYSTILFQGTVQSIVSYNTSMVDPSEFRSYWDLLNPKWKGRIISTDIRTFGAGTIPSRYLHHKLGSAFFQRLYGEMDVTIASDQRQLADWLGGGQYPLGVFIGPSQLVPAQQQGLPVNFVPPDQFAEGAPIGPGGGSLSVLDKAPHPNAATVYTNWVLSREGALAWQDQTSENSLRVDVPKDKVRPFSAPKAGVTYLDVGNESFARVGDDELMTVVVEALASRGM
ncbi:MAG: ABC-type Fe3+ transport system periplasmic component [Chloroflexi bacterium]|nr:ABC-type Fe3+ transport system periplasmic component [Chloroflexota bacterium]